MDQEQIDTNGDTALYPPRESCAPEHGADTPPFPMKLLLQPAALLAQGQPFSRSDFAGLEAARRTVERLLSSGLEQEVTLEILAEPSALFDSSDSPPPLEGRFGLELVGPDERGLVIGLDLPACRAIVDVIETRLCSLRGAEELTDSEYGLLEYTALSCLDECAQGSGPFQKPIKIRRFLTRSGLLEQLKEHSDSVRIGFQVTIGPYQGRAFLSMEGALEEMRSLIDLQAAMEPSSVLAERGSLEVTFALPPFPVDENQLAQAAVGDLLLLGRTVLSGPGAVGALLSTNGWRLCDATLEEDRAASLTIRPGTLRPEALRLPPCHRGDPLLLPLIGSARMDLEQLRSLGPEMPLDLMKDLDAPVRLLHRSQTLARGELVRADGEIAVRLLSFNRSLLGER